MSSMIGHRGYAEQAAAASHLSHSVSQSVGAQHDMDVHTRDRPNSAPPMASNFDEWIEGYSNRGLLPMPPRHASQT